MFYSFTFQTPRSEYTDGQLILHLFTISSGMLKVLYPVPAFNSSYGLASSSGSSTTRTFISLRIPSNGPSNWSVNQTPSLSSGCRCRRLWNPLLRIFLAFSVQWYSFIRGIYICIIIQPSEYQKAARFLWYYKISIKNI